MLSWLKLTCALVEEVGEQAAHDGLMAHHQHVLLPLQLHDHRLQPLHQVLIRLDTTQGILNHAANHSDTTKLILILAANHRATTQLILILAVNHRATTQLILIYAANHRATTRAE